MLTATSNTSFTPISVITNSSDINPSAGFAPMINQDTDREIVELLVALEIISIEDKRPLSEYIKDDNVQQKLKSFKFDDSMIAGLKEIPVQTLSMKEWSEIDKYIKAGSIKDQAMVKFPQLNSLIPGYNDSMLVTKSSPPPLIREAINNKLSAMPEYYDYMSEIQSLLSSPVPITKFSLDLSKFRLNSLPEGFFLSLLQYFQLALTELDISHNNLSDLNALPKEVEIVNACGNRELKILDPKTLPAGIKELDVSDTGLEVLPNFSEFKNLIIAKAV